MQVNQSIPPVAHFIWAGGTNPLKLEGVKIISEWTKRNQDVKGFQSWLWIDKQTASKTIVDDYKMALKEQGITVLDEEETENMDLSSIKPPPVILKDITKNGLRNEHVAYEIDKLRPNYGSSSDLLRYEILSKYGGFYCDCTDVTPSTSHLAEIFSAQYPKHVLYLDHCTQQPQAPLEKLQKFEVNELGNDTFAATRFNPACIKILAQARKNYVLPEGQLELPHIIIAHSGNNIKDTTISRTGPGLVRQVLLGQMKCSINKEVLLSEDQKVEIRRVRDGKLSLTIPSANTGNWLNTRITKYDNPDDAIKMVIKTIEFEAKHFKILRLDDHIKDLMESTGNQLIPKQILEILNKTIQIELKQIKYVQLTGQFLDSIEYASINQLHNIFKLPSKLCIDAINAQACLHEFIKVEQVAKIQFERLKEMAAEKQLSVEGLILSTQRQEVKENLCAQIKLGLNFIENIGQHLDKFDKLVAPEIQKHLIERLKKYQEYAPLLNSLVETKYHVDTKLIQSLLEKLNPEQKLQESKSIQFDSK